MEAGSLYLISSKSETKWLIDQIIAINPTLTSMFQVVQRIMEVLYLKSSITWLLIDLSLATWRNPPQCTDPPQDCLQRICSLMRSINAPGISGIGIIKRMTWWYTTEKIQGSYFTPSQLKVSVCVRPPHKCITTDNAVCDTLVQKWICDLQQSPEHIRYTCIHLCDDPCTLHKSITDKAVILLCKNESVIHLCDNPLHKNITRDKVV